MSSLPYIQQLTKVIVAQITQTIGWNSIQTTPLELLTDILHKHLEELTRQTQRYTELYGRTEPNLDDIALAFNDLNINVADLEEYISNVDSVPCIINVPKFPIPKDSNLNFLKPGSKEVVTRPVHINEHLPPIQPHEETPPAEEAPPIEMRVEDEHNTTNIIQTYISTNQISERPTSLDENGIFEHETSVEMTETINICAETTVVENQATTTTDENTFRRPFDVPSSQPAAQVHRPPANNNENLLNGQATREIVSCFMTTGGFISPAREGKLPDAKKPIKILEEPEPKEIEIKQRSPSPEIIERKQHTGKRENKNDSFDTIKNYGIDVQNASHADVPYKDGEMGKEVKLYEVIQTVPETPVPKKKTKKPQLEIAQLKEQKKQKRLNQLKLNRHNHAFGSITAKVGGTANAAASSSVSGYDKVKKKSVKMETLKKKHKQKQLGAMPFTESNIMLQSEKPRKKKIAKLSKKNLQAMGLNPNAIEGFAIPPTAMDPFPMQEESTYQKESLKKMKQLQKLTNEPDKQKIKFFKKLSSTSSNLLSKPNKDVHELDRMLNPTHPTVALASNSNNLFHQPRPLTDDIYDGVRQFGQMVPDPPSINDLNRLPPNLDDLTPSKKLKLLKKLNKPPKEPKIPKIRKEKKDPLAKKERTPKTPKSIDSTIVMPKPPATPEENPLTKMFLNDEFRPHSGLMNQFPMPGLNPFNPLFQSMRFDLSIRDDQMQNNPFVPGFDFSNLSRFKRPNFNEPMQSDAENLTFNSLEANNPPPKCNVAPLMPPSLLDMEMHHRNEFMPKSSMNESHMISKHYQDPMNSSFVSKKSVMFNTPNPQPLAEQTYASEKCKLYDSPIVINSDDDDDKQQNSSQSPGLPDQDPSFSGIEPKKKKVKDKKDKDKDKEKKEKKEKDSGIVKMKKKKDKKDKSKNKGDSKSPKDKSALKKEKREKKKERERSMALDTNDSMGTQSNSFYGSQSHSEWPRDAFSKESGISQIVDSSDINTIFNADNSNLETSTIPKLTLKLAPSSSSPTSRTSRPSTPDFPANKKISRKKKKQWRAMDDESEKSDDESVGVSGKPDNSSEQMVREPSPELARISALITRPPKQKSSNKQSSVEFNTPARNEYSEPSTAPIRNDYHSSIATSTPLPPTPSAGRGRPKGSSSLKTSKSKSSKASASFAIDPDKKSQIFDNQSNINDLHVVQNVIHTVDEQTNEENQVWICPACGKVDDGTPMIGCDGCDDWYHWVCVGILVPPNEDQDWFCRVCISRKQEDKKKKRKKKDKKDH